MDYQIYHLAGMHARPADLSLLDPRERDIYTHRGERYLLIRSLLKREIARRLSCAPEQIQLHISPHGKPTHPHCHFNISHSGDYLCLAFHHSAIGVDIEKIRPRPRAQLAARIMSPEQWQAYQNRGCPQAEFFACWCTAEALIKQAGSTIWKARDYPFLIENGRIIPQFDQAPTVRLFTPAPGYCGAVAYAATPHSPEQGSTAQ